MKKLLENKTILLGVTGSIAAYKAAALAHLLKKQGAQVNVIMTKNAQEIIAPLTFERLTENKCVTETFDKNIQYEVKHISLAQKADLAIVAPATANIIGKLSCGIADDMLSTTLMACTCPVYISPAMNTAMYENPIVQANIMRLKEFGYHFIEPASGLLACGDIGIGKMPEPEQIAEYIYRELAYEKDMEGLRVLVTAGATCEPIDPVRYITNRSTGKMGFAAARAAMQRGAEVTVVAGHTEAAPPPFVRLIRVNTAQEMLEAVKGEFDNTDIVIKSAAVADYTPINTAREKIKKTEGDCVIELKRTEDILKYLGEHKKKQYICGFSMETENMLENSVRKLRAKNADMIAANNLRTKGAGFGTDTNILTLITKGNTVELPIMSKDEAAHAIFDEILNAMK